MTDERTFDLICVGSGVSGCAAALAAADRGLKVCLVEKSALLGGGTAYSLGALWVGRNHLQEAAGVADTLDEARAYLSFLAGGVAVRANLDAYVDRAPGVLLAFERMGLGFRVIAGLPDHYFPDAPGAKPPGRSLEALPIRRDALGPWADMLQQGPYAPAGMSWSDAVAWGGFANRRGWDHAALEERAAQGVLGAGQALVGQFVAGLVGRDVPILNRFAARELIVGDGRVTGLRGTRRGEEIVLHAERGVVLATGGYEGSPELVERLEGVPDWRNMFPASVDGDGLRMGAEIGAAIHRIPVNLCLLLGYEVPAETPGGETGFRNAGPREFTFPHSFIVNRGGRRFADESQFQHVVPALRHFDPATHTHTNLPCYLIFDRQYLERYSFAGYDPRGDPPAWLSGSGSLADLAGRLGIDPDGLARTAARFNAHAAEGNDPEFGRGESVWSKSSGGDRTHAINPNLGPVSEPPFYGARLYPTGTGSGGLLTNEHGGVIHVRGHPIPGLYACGNTAAPTDFGAGYQAGLSLMSGIVFGYLAAEHASGARG